MVSEATNMYMYMYGLVRSSELIRGWVLAVRSDAGSSACLLGS